MNIKIGIVSAIKEEIIILKKMIYLHQIKKISNYTIYIGTFKKNKIFLIKSGIGKVSASIATMILINFYNIHLIINSGSAGSLQSFLKIGDVIIPSNTCYYDVDLTNFGYSLGQIPKYPKQFIINTHIRKFFNIFYENGLKFITGSIVSGDSFIGNNLYIKKINNQFSSAIAVEMESASIAQVCYQFNLPLFIIKAISDLSDNNATLNFKKNIMIASFQVSQFVQIILENIVNI